MYPILFEFGAITVFSLWFFIAAGFVAAAMIFVRLSKRYRVRLNLLADHSLQLFLWTLLISRITFIILHADLYFYRFQFSHLLKIFAVWDKGLSFWGAAAAWLSGIWFLARQHENAPWAVPRLMDIALPAVFFGMVFGDIGAFLDGINYGTPTDLPWGMTFRNANVKYISDIHPTQLYAAAYALAICGMLLVLLKRLRGRLPGFVAEAGILCFSFFKFLEEFVRGDEAIKIFSVRFPQLIALVAIGISGYLIFQRHENKTGGDPEHLLKNFTARLLKTRPKPNPSELREAKTSWLQNQTR